MAIMISMIQMLMGQLSQATDVKSSRVYSSSGVTSKKKGVTNRDPMDAFASLLPHEVVAQMKSSKASKTVHTAFKKGQ